MSDAGIRTRVREFLSRFFREYALQDQEDLFASGYVNSMFAMQLVQFVETECGVTLESDELDVDNFRSIDAIVGLMSRKSAVPA